MMGLRFVSLCILLFSSFSLTAADTTSTDTEATDSTDEETEIIPRFDQVFNNPIITQDLEAGSQVANNAYDSLLEGVFYHLLDNKFAQKLTGTFSFNEALTRQVFTTGQGKYVIVDRVNIGPSYTKALPTLFQKIPISFNASTDIDLMSIYLRSDPQRIHESSSLPTWRYWFNIWFGFIPFLERILPPSFDSNEIYDPLREIEGPFSFPVDAEAFKKMEVGNIQSYAFQGGIALPFFLDGLFSTFAIPELNKLSLIPSAPYTLFVQGEYRINVLKRSENIAWVGLSNLKRGGHSLAGFIGTTIYLFANSLGPIPWKGVPAQLSPIDLSIVESLQDRFDEIYEFDMSKKKAAESFEKAISGDFTFGKKPTLPEGVRFHFSQSTVSNTLEKINYKNFILLFRTSYDHLLSKSEIKIRDEHGEFYVLENINSHSDSNFNIFTGEQEIDLTNELDLNVGKERSPDFTFEEPKFVYQFHKSMKPYQLILKVQIKDRFTDVKHFNSYVSLLRNVTQLPLDEIPSIPQITEKSLAKRQKNAFFSSPDDAPYNIHTTSSMVGKFSANALVVFDSRDIKEILMKSKEDTSKAFYLAYERKKEQDMSPSLEYFRSYMYYPLRIFDYKSIEVDAFREIDRACMALSKISQESEPLDLSNSFNELFKTDYPYALITALYGLSKIENIPRNVTLYVSPSGDLDDTLKKSLTDLNAKTFRANAKFPELERYRVAKNKLEAFVPISQKERGSILSISKVSISDDQILRVVLNDKAPRTTKRFFIKIGSKGQFKITQSSYGSKLLDVAPTVGKDKIPVYAIPIFTDKGLLAELVSTNSLSEDSLYIVVISASEIDGSWSAETSTTVLYHNGRFEIAPPDKAKADKDQPAGTN